MKFFEVFGNAKYVLSADKNQFPYVRKSFFIEKPIKKATLTVSVLGFCELCVNGEKITDVLYVTTYSQYNAQTLKDIGNISPEDGYFNDELRYSVYYSQFDVTRFLKTGKNALGIVVSGGWYRTGNDKYGTHRNYGDTKTCFRLQIECEDGERIEVLSDAACKVYESFLIEGGIYHEEQDERKEIVDFSSADFDDSSWGYAVEVDAPEAEYRLNECPANKIIRWVKPKLVKSTSKYAVYDAGENITGFPVLKTVCGVGEELRCVYSETLTAEGYIDPEHGYKQESIFITDGRKEHNIRFTWHGFRYFQVSCTGGAVTCDRCAIVHADIKNTSTFQSDSEILNWIYDAFVRSQLGNYQCGVPTDCPQIERKGYTGDGQLLCDLGMMLFNSRALYKKWLQDISDCQDAKTGFVHYTAPCFVGCGGGPGGWSVAVIAVPYAYYRAYGDKAVLEEFYPKMCKYVEYMEYSSADGLVTIRDRIGWCLGDWESPRGRDGLLPPSFVNTCFYINALQQLSKIAVLLGKETDCERYKRRIVELQNSVNLAYYDAATSNYCGNDQGANAIALKAGLGNAKTQKNLADRYAEAEEFDTGIFATKILIENLFKNGYADVAYSMLNSQGECSFNDWKRKGATTLYESWKNARSYNHPMFGAVVEYFFTYLLGIRQAGDSCGYKKVLINPIALEKVNTLSGSIQTVLGRIAVSITRKDVQSTFIVEIPDGVEGEFVYGNMRIKLSAGENKIVI